MANDLNKWMGIGRLGKDPEIRYSTNGDAVANFSVACGRSWKDKNSGEKVEQTEWVRCVAFGKLAEICGEWLKKGQQVFVEGRLQTRKWQDREGNDKYTTEVVLETMQMLGGKRDSGDNAPESEHRQRPQQSAPAAPPFDDDIPF